MIANRSKSLKFELGGMEPARRASDAMAPSAAIGERPSNFGLKATNGANHPQGNFGAMHSCALISWVPGRSGSRPGTPGEGVA